MNANDIKLAVRARAVFDCSVETIDADTRVRLRESRLQAQDASGKHAGLHWRWIAGVAFSAIFMLVMLVPQLPRAPPAAAPASRTSIPAIQAAAGVDDVATTASDALETVDPDMLSDLDFYGWLAKQPSTNPDGG